MPPNRRALSGQVLDNLGQGVTWPSSSSRAGWLYRSSAGRLPTQCSRSGHLAQRAPRAVGLPDLQYAVPPRSACTKRRVLTCVDMEEVDAAEWEAAWGGSPTDTGRGALHAAVRGDNHFEPALLDGIRLHIQGSPPGSPQAGARRRSRFCSLPLPGAPWLALTLYGGTQHPFL
jgi:hypothetical protein